VNAMAEMMTADKSNIRFFMGASNIVIFFVTVQP
jgi:hypothetical protein